MKYEFRIYDKTTNDVLFETTVEGPDKHRCAARAARAGKEAGFNLTSVGKSVRAITENDGDPQPYTFQLKQIDFDPAEHEAKINGRRYEAQERYDAKNTKQIRMKLNLKTDADILYKLENVGNVQGYIKELIRRDMEMGERFVVRDHEAGNEIDRFTTRTEALETMKIFVQGDKEDGTYEPAFYEVYDEEAEEIIAVSE